MYVQIDREGCIGCGTCEALCPEVFQMGEDGLACVVGQPDGNLWDETRSTAADCPVSVIHVVDD